MFAEPLQNFDYFRCPKDSAAAPTDCGTCMSAPSEALAALCGAFLLISSRFGCRAGGLEG
jgi:hypothetical protein